MSSAISSDIYVENAAKSAGRCYRVIYNFGNTPTADSICSPDIVQVYPEDIYSEKKGYGFITEEARKINPSLNIDEINDGFSPYSWHKNDHFIVPSADENGVHLDNGIVEDGYIPLTFKAKIPHQGNYKVTLVLSAGEEPIQGITIFSGERRLESLKGDYCPHEVRAYVFNVNVCDVIAADGSVLHDDTIDITVIGSSPVFTTLTIEESDTPTIYIIGDAQAADRACNYPYYPESNHCGWGQFFTYYVSNLAAVSNHAYVGATTVSYRSDGHFDNLKSHIKPGDFIIIQFGLGDSLAGISCEEYKNNLNNLISEFKNLEAKVVLATPLAGNTFDSNGTYLDTLVDYAVVCEKLAGEREIPLIQLHMVSKEFITRVGKEDAMRYYYPGENMVPNDFGAYLMAGYIAKEIKRIRDICPIPIRTSLCGKVYDPVMNVKRPMNMEELMESDNFVPPKSVHLAQPRN